MSNTNPQTRQEEKPKDPYQKYKDFKWEIVQASVQILYKNIKEI